MMMGPAPIIMMEEISVLFGMSVPGQLGGCAQALPTRKLVGLYPSPAGVQGASPAALSGAGHLARRVVEDHPVERAETLPVALWVEDQPIDDLPGQSVGREGDKPGVTCGESVLCHEALTEIALDHHARRATL